MQLDHDFKQTDGEHAGGLRGKLGVTGIVVMVIATSTPLGLAAGGAPLAIGLGNGAGAAGTFVLVGCVMLLFSVALAAMSKFVTNAGAFYAYVGRGLGPFAGIAAAGIAWVTYMAIQVGTSAFLGVQVSAVIVMLGGPEISWWICSLVMLAIIGGLGYRRIDLAAKVLGVVLVLEIACVTVVDIMVALRGGVADADTSGFLPGAVFSDMGHFSVAVMFCAICFMGFESTAVFREEAKDPDRTVPRATYIAICFIGVFYAVTTYLISIAWPADRLQEEAVTGAPFFLSVATEFVGAWLADVILALLAMSLFAVSLSLHNILARYSYMMGRSGVINERLGAVHPQHGSPYVASVMTSITTFVLLGVAIVAGLDPVIEILAWFAGISALGFVVLLCLTCLSAVVFFGHESRAENLWTHRIGPAAGFVLLAILVVLTLVKFPTLIGRSDVFSYSLAATVPAVALIAVGGAIFLRRTRPHRYQGVIELTQSDVR